MSLFNLPVQSSKEPKPTSVHPWSRGIKHQYLSDIKLSHNSVNNPRYPKPKQKKVGSKQINFTVVGNRLTKEFMYCVNLVKGMHKYRSKRFGPPVIRAVTGVEWESNTLREIQIQYGHYAHCLEGQVAVIANGQLVGGETELKEMIESKYYINLLALNYQKESINAFARYQKEIGRPVAYIHITISGKPIGSLMFMLYSDIVPRTCENFLRLCRAKRGGYAGTPVHRIVKDGWIQCGGFGLKNTEMDCENFKVDFDRRGVLGMANAGRDLDCSTQFFVLLQPNKCFKLRFVAFGQLIEGADTLKKIEEVETYYEAPLDEIMIVTAGIVNLDCKDIRIQKDAREYIDKHIDDLVIIGEMFYAMLLENVFLEAELRELQRMQPTSSEGDELQGEDAFGQYVDEQGNYIPENIRATRRFIRKKSELQKANAEKLERDNSFIKGNKKPYHKDKQNLPRSTHKADGGENNEFDVEDYEPEEYTYSQVSGPSSIKKDTSPYCLALTDVPYPGEKSSNFDLRRFLKGDYCLETDLSEEKAAIKKYHKQWQRDQKMQAVSQIISSYGSVRWGVNSESDSDESTSSGILDSDDEQEIKDYLSQYGEKVSFSGNLVKAISKKHVSKNPVKDKLSSEIWNDEELRRLRMAVQDIESRVTKKVSLNVEPWQTHTEIKRRMTGYVRRSQVEDFDEVEEENKMSAQDRKVSVQIYAPIKTTQRTIHRRQTGFVPSSVSAKFEENDDDNDDNDDDTKSIVSQQSAGGDKRKTSVRIAPRGLNVEHHPSILVQKSKDPSVESGFTDKARPSVLMRLYDDIAIDEKGVSPTLKDFKPIPNTHKKIFTLAEDMGETLFLRRSMNVFQKQLSEKKSSFEIANGKRSTSVDYSSRPWAEIITLNNVDYNRKRPSISVAQYQQKNKIEMEALANKNQEEEMRQMKEETKKNQTEAIVPKFQGRKGLRLPGDSPMYVDSASAVMYRE
ncbi:hypothetical protein O0L34_g6071 [Tuta absoluta]|nr:hypothetical protein O0L34_g6071 [Tuta absoluta]